MLPARLPLGDRGGGERWGERERAHRVFVERDGEGEERAHRVFVQEREIRHTSQNIEIIEARH